MKKLIVVTLMILLGTEMNLLHAEEGENIAPPKGPYRPIYRSDPFSWPQTVQPGNRHGEQAGDPASNDQGRSSSMSPVSPTQSGRWGGYGEVPPWVKQRHAEMMARSQRPPTAENNFQRPFMQPQIEEPAWVKQRRAEMQSGSQQPPSAVNNFQRSFQPPQFEEPAWVKQRKQWMAQQQQVAAPRPTWSQAIQPEELSSDQQAMGQEQESSPQPMAPPQYFPQPTAPAYGPMNGPAYPRFGPGPGPGMQQPPAPWQQSPLGWR